MTSIAVGPNRSPRRRTKLLLLVIVHHLPRSKAIVTIIARVVAELLLPLVPVVPVESLVRTKVLRSLVLVRSVWSRSSTKRANASSSISTIIAAIVELVVHVLATVGRRGRTTGMRTAID